MHVISSDVIYKGKWLTLRKDQIIKADGVHGIYEVIERKDIVAVIPKESEFFYMVEQYRHAVKARSLEFPGGFIDALESPLQAAKRELKEEIGVQAKNIKLLNTIWVVSGYSTQKLHIFLAENLTHAAQKLDDTEGDLKIKKFTIEEIERLIKTGIIKNSPTIATFAMYTIFLRANRKHVV